MKNLMGALGLGAVLGLASSAAAQQVPLHPISVPEALSQFQSSIDAIAITLVQLRNDTQLDLGDVQARLDDIELALMDLETDLLGVQDSLRDIPRAWARALPAADRFEVVLGGAAVFDRETHLVWDRSPSAFSFVFGQRVCTSQVIGNRMGWRLPTVSELTSLVDFAVTGGTEEDPMVLLPIGHPFNSVRPLSYFTSNVSRSGETTLAVSFRQPTPAAGRVQSISTTGAALVLCVRGDQARE
jgi:hypothetical protein